jgi:hypothetical protein
MEKHAAGSFCRPAKGDDTKEATFVDAITDYQMMSWAIVKVSPFAQFALI